MDNEVEIKSALKGLNEEELKLALKWFKENDVYAYEDDGRIYVQAGRDADVEITSRDVSYRAELQKMIEKEIN